MASTNSAILERILENIQALRTDVAVLKTDVAVLKTDVAVLKTDVAVLKTDVAVLKTDVAVLKTDVAVLKTDVAVLKTDVAVLKTDVAVLKTDVAALKTDVSALKTDVAALKTDVAALKTDVAALKTDMSDVKKELGDLKHEYHAYTKREGDIQECVDVNKFIHAWEKEQITPAYVFPLRNFFRANINSLLTDLDGCVLIGEGELAHSAYIIESKHGLTVEELLRKLNQFCEIINTVSALHDGGQEWLEKQSYEFQAMVAKHDLFKFPKEIYFMIASDSMSKNMQAYIIKINNGVTKRNELQQVILFQGSELFERIQTSKIIPRWVKERLAVAKSINTVLKIVSSPTAYLKDYEKEIQAMFPETDPCFTKLQGRLGILCLDLVVWPTGDRLLSASHRGGKRKTRKAY
jgi:phage shock protein A